MDRGRSPQEERNKARRESSRFIAATMLRNLTRARNFLTLRSTGDVLVRGSLVRSKSGAWAIRNGEASSGLKSAVQYTNPINLHPYFRSPFGPAGAGFLNSKSVIDLTRSSSFKELIRMVLIV